MSSRQPYNRGKRSTRDHSSYDSVNDGHRPKHDGKVTETRSKFRTRNERSPGPGPGRGYGRFGHDRGSKEGRPPSARGRERDDAKRRDPPDRERTVYNRSKNTHDYPHNTHSNRGSSETSPRQNGSGNSTSDSSSGTNLGVATREFVSSEFKRQSGQDVKNFSDDTRLSKLVRRVCRDDERDWRIAAVKQLREFLLLPENVKTITKAADNLLVTLQEIFYERTFKEVKQEVALCIAAIGVVMGNEAVRYFQWLSTKLSAVQADEVKILLLTALIETIKQDNGRKNLVEFLPLVMCNCQAILESADQPELLIAVVDVLLQVSHVYPSVFASHFKDTVDILVGWHIDPTQKEYLLQYTSESLVGFHPFWVNDVTFSVTLLGQFLEDMEAYAEDLVLGSNGQTGIDEDMPTPTECITKLTALLGVFTTVVKSLGDYMTPNRGPPITVEYTVDMLERVVKCVDGAVKCIHSDKTLIAVNNCLGLLVTSLGSHTAQTCEVLLPFLIDQVQQQKLGGNVYIISLLSLIQKVVETVNTQLPVVFISQSLATESLLYKLRFAQNKQVVTSLMAVFHAILALKNVPLLEEAYRYMLGDVEIAMNTLLESTESDYQCHLVSTNPYHQVAYSCKQAQAVIVFDVCALAEIGNTKNNLIGMWALAPSIFELFTKHLLAGHHRVMEQHPAVHYALLQTLYSHCCRHGHFISSSQLITQNTVLEGTLLANVSPSTGNHFTTQLTLLTEHFNWSNNPCDGRRLCLKWCHEIVEALHSTQHIYKSREFTAMIDSLVTLGFSCNSSEITYLISQCLQAWLVTANTQPAVLMKRCVELCGLHMSDSHARTRQAYTNLLRLLPLDITLRHTSCFLLSKGQKEKTGHVTSLEAHWLVRRGHMARVPLGTFHSHNFKSVMSYILHGVQPSKLLSSQWLERLYHTCQKPVKDPDRDGRGSGKFDNNLSQLWFWAMWESAQFCVLAKLRTPLGKPQETFTSIEASLKKLSTEVRNLEAGEANSGSPSHLEKESSGLTGSHTRVVLLLQFMEYLEKLLYNAYEGCAVAMVAPPKTVRTFFRTNRGTCQEWLMRVRMCIITIAEHCSQPAVVVRQAYELLQDMKETNNTQLPEFEHVILHAVRALCQLQCPEAIQGLYAWCKEVVGGKLPWIKTTMDMANRRYETAIIDYQTALRTYLSPDTSLEDTKEQGEAVSSRNSSPVGSPKHSVSGSDSFQRLSILGASSGSATDVSHSEGPDPVLAHFMVQQVQECYERLADWHDVLDWQEKIQQYRTEHSESSLCQAFSTGTDINYIRSLAHFEEFEFHEVANQLELIPGCSLDAPRGDHPLPEVIWAPKDLAATAHQQFVRAVTLCHTSTWSNSLEVACLWLEQAKQTCEAVLQTTDLVWPPRPQREAMLQLYCADLCLAQLSNKKSKKAVVLPLSDSLQLEPTEHDVSTAMQALQLLEIQYNMHEVLQLDTSPDFIGQISRLKLAAARLARKQQNYRLSENLLIDEVYNSLSVQPENDNLDQLENISVALSKIYTCNGTMDQVKLINIEREGAKLLHSKGQCREAIETLALSIVGHVQTNASTTAISVHSKEVAARTSELNARSLLSLVQWLQQEHKHLAMLASQVQQGGQGDEGSVAAGVRNLKVLMELEQTGIQQRKGIILDELGEHEPKLGDHPILSDSERVVARLLHLSTMQAPALSKAWFALAGWCYKWGRKAVDNAVHGSVDLSVEEKARVLELLPKGTSSEETESALNILSQIHAGITSEEDISDQDQSLYDEGTETTRRQLLSSCMTLQIASDDTVDQLIGVWRGVVRRVYHYYQLSAKAYFTYLHLSEKTSEKSSVDGNITATLRLLRLLVKHAWELRGVLEDGLAHTPTHPWKGIIPQLFSRLNHPEPYVRQSVSDLLCRVAQDAPHLIVYPAVVGCSGNKVVDKESNRDRLLNRYLSEQAEDQDDQDVTEVTEDKVSQEEEEETMATDDGGDDVLQVCFSSIVETLANSNPRMISEVRLLISELRRITLLYDELWLGTLNQHHQDMTRRLTQLDNEVKKVLNNTSLSKEEKTAIVREKHNTVLKPTVYTMERLRDITSLPPETKHEQWFQDTYGKVIDEALEKLKNPNDPTHPATSWQLFKQLHHSLQQKAQKRSSLVLNMEEISGQLAAVKDTVIAMPGITNLGQPVTVAAIHHTVQILPTKTKPKKLVFMGSDGKKYPYLFKGLEDLHLDERIMQFLALVNNMFAKTNTDDRRLYYARHYSVTPLGAKSGLIQWVDGATPLFSLYKRWQQREAMVAQQKQGSSSSVQSSNPPAIPRPSEVYYGKLTPSLKDKGITNLDSRKEWPVTVMKRVLEELMAETPKDLLARELWCSSTSASEWWQVTQTYARSTAVMSMIGYIIGLGDRHLDNVLVDLSTGEVVHIDYNVCFEKGKGLRVPEKVPFRMTQNIEAALGVTGVEGIFRVSCEHVIKTMRKGRETLLTLLEAFVYDPLVDWTTGNEGGYTGAFYGGGHSAATGAEGRQSKKEMEKEITLSMFSIRIAEMKASWFHNRDEMLGSLPSLVDATQTHLKSQADLQTLETRTERLDEQKAYLHEAMADDTQHPLYSLHQRFEAHSIVKNSKTEAQQAVQEKLDDYQEWNKAHQYAMEATQGSKLQKLCADSVIPQAVTQSAFAPVVDFLQGAGQGQMVTQCELVAVEMSAMLQQRRVICRTTLDILRTYATIMSHYPHQFMEDNRSAKWENWLLELLCDFTSDKCKELVGQFQDMYGMPANGVHPRTQQILATEAKLQTVVAELNHKLIKLIERRNQEMIDTALLDGYVVETTSAVHHFMRENGLSGVSCMTSVVMSALCSLSKRYLVMEGAAAAAGERLMDLTSRDGDWFLDELCSMSGNVNQLLLGALNDPSVCQLLRAETCHVVMHAMNATHAVYMALQDLNVNFRNIILPECLKTLQCGDPSVTSILAQLDAIVDSSGRPPGTLLSQLETQLRNTIMDLQTDDEVITVVRDMRQQFDQLLQGSESTELTPGQMLLMGFNGLFIRLESDFSAMLEQVSRVSVPDVWRKVDVVREARSIQMTAFTDSTQSLLSKLFFVKQLKAMQNFFHLAMEHTATLTGASVGPCYDDDQLAKPIKHFTAEYVRKHLIGLPSQTLGYILCMYINALKVDVTAEIELRDIGAESKVGLEELCKKVLDLSVKNEVFEHVHLTQATSLIAANDVSWRKSDLAKRLDNNVTILKAGLQRVQLQLARYQWLHEDTLTAAGRHPTQMLMPNRTTVMSEIRKSMQALVSPENSLTPIQERHLQLEGSVSQRLKWGAGANPTLAAILQQFEQMVATKDAMIQSDNSLSSDVVAICNAVLHFEAMRTRTPEAMSADTAFLSLLARCEESCQLIESCGSTVTEIEESLMVTKPLEVGETVTPTWMQATLEQLDTQTEVVNSQMDTFKAACDASKEGVKEQVNNIRAILTTHHKLMSDIRSILKSMAKQEEQDCGLDVLPGSIRQYVNTYKTFSENFTTVLKLVMADDLTKEVLGDVLGMVDTLKQQIQLIYNDLVQFAPPLSTLKPEQDNSPAAPSFATALKRSESNFPPVSPKKIGAAVTRPDLFTGTPSSVNSPQTVPIKFGTPTVRKADKVTRDPKTGKAIQERNSYAVGVWRRVKMKLDGRDPDINKRFSVPEQVDYVMKEATSLDNLAVLYEGWTPWV